jgi:hypothetical protein
MTTTAPAPAAVTDPAIPMTEEQKFIFDMKGWLLLPGVLEPDLIEAVREHVQVLTTTPEKLAPRDRHSYGGPAAELLDHPAIVGILREIIAKDVNGKAYGFRCDGSYAQHRTVTHKSEGIDPHGGGPNVIPTFSYQCKNQQIYSALTRVVWELNEVEKGAGGTLLMSGSHKANFAVPPEHLKKNSWLFETYSCPPGSILFFTENLCHSGAKWTSKTPRVAVFNCYSHHQTQFHKMRWDAEAIEAMPPKRRTLCRGVWGADFHNMPPVVLNDWYSSDNRAL